MKVYQALAKAFAGEGTKAVFGLMGDANMYWMNAIDDFGVPVYETRHEGNALGMADGWAHNNNGQPGVCSTTCGPGTSQLATSLLVASRGKSPIVAFCGEAPLNNPDYHQAFDQKLFAAATECGYVPLGQPEMAFESARKAFYLARLESRPVMLGAPMDTQMMAFDDDDDYVASSSLFTALPTGPNLEALNIAAEIVARSRRPVIIVGIGAKRSHAEKEILRLAENIGAVIATSMVAKNWLGNDEFQVGISGLFSTRTAIELFQESDCVIAIGASMNSHTTEHGYLFPNATFVQFDVNPQVVMGDGHSADCYVQADAAVGIAALNEVLDTRSFHQSGFRVPEVKERLASAIDDPEVFDVAPGELDTREVCRALDKSIPENVGLVIGSGHATNIAIFLFNRTRSFINMRKSFGCIGQGLSHSIGASMAHNKAPVFLVDGDVSFMMHLGEFETAVRYEIPLLVCVLNDEAMGAELHKSEAHGLKAEMSQIPTPDLGVVATGLGGRGRLVRTMDELNSAAAEFVNNPGPMVIDIRVSRKVLSIQSRRKVFGRDDI